MNSTDLTSSTFVIIPMYNERATIRILVEHILQYVNNIIIVDDYSSDNSQEQITHLPITIVRNSCNLGKGSSMARGFAEAISRGASRIITIDADGQHDANDIPRLLHASNQFPEYIIIGARLRKRETVPRQRSLANHCGDFFISWAASSKILDTQSGFRVYPVKYIQDLDLSFQQSMRFEYESKLLIDAASKGFKFAAVAIDAHYSKNFRPSYFKPFSDLLKLTKMIAYQLMKKGFNLPGLYKMLRQRMIIVSDQISKEKTNEL